MRLVEFVSIKGKSITGSRAKTSGWIWPMEASSSSRTFAPTTGSP